MKFFFLLSLFALVSGANFAITTTFQGPSCNSSLAVSSDVRVLDKCVSDGGRYLRFTCQDGILSILTYKNPTCSLTPTVAKKTLGCSASASGLYTSIVCSPNFPALLNVSSVIVRYSAPAVEKCKYNFLTRFTVAYNDTTGICARNPVRCSNTGKNSSETRVCKKDFQISDFIPSSSTSFSSRGNTTLITRSSVSSRTSSKSSSIVSTRTSSRSSFPSSTSVKPTTRSGSKIPTKTKKTKTKTRTSKTKTISTKSATRTKAVTNTFTISSGNKTVIASSATNVTYSTIDVTTNAVRPTRNSVSFVAPFFTLLFLSVAALF
eukprot:TRINITY_DN3775_c0_g1_i2.p1 TRINITY_DN3775_c0_g1~~TRINITY_DN3775_c0_g1_i2.p1  ORF type:complete len:320 (+),score=86.81 TRINITY_DN3775_c0_g1_i2:203-1162(+)